MTLLFVYDFTKGGVMGINKSTQRGEITAHLPVLWLSLNSHIRQLEENNYA